MSIRVPIRMSIGMYDVGQDVACVWRSELVRGISGWPADFRIPRLLAIVLMAIPWGLA